MQMIKPFGIDGHNERPKHIERNSIDVVPPRLNVQSLKTDRAFATKRTVLTVIAEKMPSPDVIAVPLRSGRFRWWFRRWNCVECIRLRRSQLG